MYGRIHRPGYSCIYETFLYNTTNLKTKTSSVWSLLNRQSTTQLFINPSFDETAKVLYPKSSISDLCFWSQTYSSGTQYTPGSSEHASSPLVNRSTADQKLKRSSSSKRFLIKKRNKKDSKLKQQLVY
ncbi:unnamed protein product [Rotaria sp. Silwood1]|nr:unnamed protein product [Rotaria sp. Silwood1]